VHFHDTYHPFQTALSFQFDRQKIPYLVSIHGGFHPQAQRRKAWKKVFWKPVLFFDNFIKRALAVHALNDAEAGFVKKTLSGKRVFIMPNGVPDSTVSLIRSERSFGETGVFTVGFIGSWMCTEGDQSFIEGHRRDPA